MPTVLPSPRTPTKPPPDDEAEDPYCALLMAIVRRAVCDAQGQVSPSVSVPTALLQQEARAWLSDEEEVAGLLELTGLDADPVLKRVRQMLVELPLRTPTAVGQLALF